MLIKLAKFLKGFLKNNYISCVIYISYLIKVNHFLYCMYNIL